MIRRPQRSTLFPYPTLSRSKKAATNPPCPNHTTSTATSSTSSSDSAYTNHQRYQPRSLMRPSSSFTDRKSTRLNSSHGYISYAVFCLKKKKKKTYTTRHELV